MLPFFSSRGVLGLNARNLLYIKPFNPRKAVAFADDKLKTKAFLAARGIPVAKIYAKIETRAQLQAFDFAALPDECVLKPNYGFGGEGILILKGRKDGEFLVQGKKPISDLELREHIEDILDGKFSISGRADTAFFEKILVADPAFAPFRPTGLPDIRIVVFNLVPIMAMIRIPTAQSSGKANVHLGGIGIGIDIAKGVTTHATQYNKILKELPHGGSPAGIAIPRWEEMLLISSRIQQITNIGYLAVDLTLDADQGPALLEVNARAGLMLQVANLAPLRSRLERVEGLKVSSPEKAVRIAQDLFGEKVRTRKEEEGGQKPLLGTREVIVISGAGVTISVPSIIAPYEERSVFSPDLVEELRKANGLDVEDEEEGTYRVKFSLAGKKIQTLVHEGTVPVPSARALIGRRDLSGFLIDPVKETKHSLVGLAVREDLRAVDNVLAMADRALLPLKQLKPTNLQEERQKATSDRAYNPVFSFPPLPENIDELEQRLSGLVPDDTPLGILFQKKRRELLTRISLFRARGNAVRFTEASLSLYGSPSAVLLSHAAAVLRSRIACDLPASEGKVLDAAAASVRFEQALEQYGLHEWQVQVRPGVVSDCTVGRKRVYLRQSATFTQARLEALIAHEIETHALTQVNGDHQPFELLHIGTANYMDTQEGLAIYNQNAVLSPHHDKRYDPAKNVLAVAYALDHSFADVRRYLEEGLSYAPDAALMRAIRLKRGMGDTSEPGAFTRDIVYFRGFRAVERFAEEGGDLKRLYVGKVAVEDLPLIEQIPGLKQPLVLPEFLRMAKKGK
ncbi:DUF1704 domain-containing protein [Candidatus Peregrinibacteria bacterium]|nr:DUF1704 domain-containing protein [Candidatus Peregrinibacteria bacterium]